ncbi:hypothetical protein [Holdemanella biformis]|uniref:hypothetical protein n=1 Tax=Holdemanella biformis TaxID=1735 RepID=UPI003A94B2A9
MELILVRQPAPIKIKNGVLYPSKFTPYNISKNGIPKSAHPTNTKTENYIAIKNTF